MGTKKGKKKKRTAGDIVRYVVMFIAIGVFLFSAKTVGKDFS